MPVRLAEVLNSGSAGCRIVSPDTWRPIAHRNPERLMPLS